MSDSAETTQQKMDRRKKRTSTNQYMMYIEMMEKDPVFATGRIPRDYDSNYLTRKWKELSDKLNNCNNGPTLTSEEWRKRLNDWKNTTRCKYRRSVSGEKDITMTSLELRALDLFGKVPATAPPEQISIHFKSEKEEEEDEEMEHIPTTETFQKQLQAAVEEAIGDDEGEQHIVESEHEEHEEIIPENTHSSTMAHGGSHGVGGGGSSNHGNSSGGTTYRTIVVEDTAYPEDDNNQDEQLEYISHRRSTLNSSNNGSAIQTAVVTNTPTATVTKLINGDIPLKRLRSQISDQIIYEVKKAPRTYTVSHPHIQQHQSQTQQHQEHKYHPQHQQHIAQDIPSSSATTLGGQIFASQDVREVARQLKRLADIKTEKLKFDIARYKFNNPGFSYNFNPL